MTDLPTRMESVRSHDFTGRMLPVVLMLLLGALHPLAARGQEAAVHAVLFFSPTCPHCHKVMTEDLPPLAEKYGEGLVLAIVDVTTVRGQEMYKATVDHFGLKSPRIGVPTLVVGSDVLVGDMEIPARFPGLIEQGLAAGGVDWPEVPEIRKALAEKGMVRGDSSSARVVPPADSSSAISSGLSTKPSPSGPLAAFSLDPVGNGSAVVVLLGLLAALFISGRAVLSGARPGRPIPTWVLPLLSAVGMGVASYLAFIEVTGQEAICGPVGNCNAVQQSPYAILFGVLPVGILGQFGYLALFAVWMAADLGSRRLAPAFWKLLWAMAFVGTLFSAYLTFLEPFVIGATCAWCLTSAVVMALILLVATGRTTPTGRAPSLS